MMSLMLPATLAFLVALFGMPSLIMLAKRKHLVDEPSEARKMHLTLGMFMMRKCLSKSCLQIFFSKNCDRSYL